MGIWDECKGTKYIEPIRGTLLRLVESHAEVATLGYVDTLEEQAVLEALLEGTESSYPADCAGMHYLVKAPFRKAPLKWGSRFGRRHERGIFYGGLSIGSTLAESAYYRFIFWFSMNAVPPKPRITTRHSLFEADYRTEVGVKLHRPLFDVHRPALTDPTSYGPTQRLGTDMRAAGVQAFEYVSARDPEMGHCVGLFTPKALSDNRPNCVSAWLCELSATCVSFKRYGESLVWTYPASAFEVNGRLPLPA